MHNTSNAAALCPRRPPCLKHNLSLTGRGWGDFHPSPRAFVTSPQQPPRRPLPSRDICWKNITVLPAPAAGRLLPFRLALPRHPPRFRSRAHVRTPHPLRFRSHTHVPHTTPSAFPLLRSRAARHTLRVSAPALTCRSLCISTPTCRTPHLPRFHSHAHVLHTCRPPIPVSDHQLTCRLLTLQLTTHSITYCRQCPESLTPLYKTKFCLHYLNHLRPDRVKTHQTVHHITIMFNTKQPLA